MDIKKVYIRDSNFWHAEYASQLTPAIRPPIYMTWARQDAPSGELVVLTDAHIHETLPNNKTAAWLMESPEINPGIYRYIQDNINQHSEVWTHKKSILDLGHSHVKFCPAGGCWISEQDLGVNQKSKLCSIIASPKNYTVGHRMRHQSIILLNSKVDSFGPTYTQLENKITALKDYMYSVVIENAKVDYYFTEKLIDVIATGGIPIYWGCPSISKFFNTDGFIIFDRVDELPEIINKCTPEFYQSKLPAIKENFELAKKYFVVEDWIGKNILNLKPSKLPLPQNIIGSVP